ENYVKGGGLRTKSFRHRLAIGPYRGIKFNDRTARGTEVSARDDKATPVKQRNDVFRPVPGGVVRGLLSPREISVNDIQSCFSLITILNAEETISRTKSAVPDFCVNATKKRGKRKANS